MPIEFLLRKFMKESLYRKALMNLIAMEGSVLILSTGYIHNSYQSANKQALDDLAQAINNRNAKFSNELTVKIVGGDADTNGIYPSNFMNFCSELYTKITDKTKCKIKFQRVVGDNWHGKVAVKLNEDILNFTNNKYYGAVIGSSNLTPINILNSEFGWNLEADLYLVDGNEVSDQSLHRVKEDSCSIQKCTMEIKGNVDKTLSRLNKIKKELNIYLINPVKEGEINSNEDLKILQTQCKGYLNGNIERDKKYLFYSILQSIADIIKLQRIRNEFYKSFEDIRVPGNDLAAKINSIKEVDIEIYNASARILDRVIKLYKDKENGTFEDFDDIYNRLKNFENQHKEMIKSCEELYIKEFFSSLGIFKDAINRIRRSLFVFKTVYDLKTDGPFIESMLKGIYIEINDIIDNFAIEELSL